MKRRGKGRIQKAIRRRSRFFQAVELYEYCVKQFKGGLRVMMREQHWFDDETDDVGRETMGFTQKMERTGLEWRERKVGLIEITAM